MISMEGEILELNPIFKLRANTVTVVVSINVQRWCKETRAALQVSRRMIALPVFVKQSNPRIRITLHV